MRNRRIQWYGKAVHCILGAYKARNRRWLPLRLAGGTLAPQRPQATEHRTGPWTHFKHARSGLGEPGALAQPAHDNDSDDRIVGAADAAAGRTWSAYNMDIKSTVTVTVHLAPSRVQGINTSFQVCLSMYISYVFIPFILSWISTIRYSIPIIRYIPM